MNILFTLTRRYGIGLLLIGCGCGCVVGLLGQPVDTDRAGVPALSVAGEGGYVSSELIYPLDDTPTPQCHASTIVDTPSGLVAAWFGGTREKHQDVGIWVSRQSDGMWSEPVEVVDGSEGEETEYPCWNPVLFQPATGRLMLFYKVGPSPREWWGMVMTSADGGETWSEPRRLGRSDWLGEPNTRLIGPVKNKPVELPDGTILCPSSSEHNEWRVHFERSSDGGETWEVIGPIHDGKTFGAIQPSVLTHPDGRMQVLCRSRQNVIAQSWSTDGGATWSPMSGTELPNPSAGTDAVTLRDGRQLLVYNHTTRRTGGRNMLNVAVSGNGTDWTPMLTLENSDGEYSYPAVIQGRDGMVHVTYTYRRRSVKHVVLDPAKLYPNIVLIYADDLGYGDVQCYNPDRGKIPTPHIDRLAASGMLFTDAHSSSGVCSPSRYSLLTGRYHWRTRLQRGIVGLWGRPLIDPDRLTLGGLLKTRGYRTAIVGKWHLGWDWPIPTERAAIFKAKQKGTDAAPPDEQVAAWREVFSLRIPGGPIDRGFDRYFGTDVPNWPPFCFIQDDRLQGVPSQFLPSSLMGNNLASVQGPALSGWTLTPILPKLADRASELIERSAGSGEPFFLYMPLTSPHTPLAVNDEWKGRSGLNRYADLVMETDAVVGRVMAVLDRAGLSKNTLVIFTSDNGCAPYIGASDLEAAGHFPSGPLRGYKSDVWEGGHRVPFIVRWPGRVRANTRCDQLVQQTDLMATIAEVVNAALPDSAGEDSVSILPLLRGGDAPVRDHGVNQSSSGLTALRQGPWKLIFGSGSGGWSKGGDALPGQLFNLAEDLSESHNRFAERPELVAELTERMARIVAEGRSTPGAKQANDVPVKWSRIPEAK